MRKISMRYIKSNRCQFLKMPMRHADGHRLIWLHEHDPPLPGLISLVLVIRGRIETAFLSVYLPSLLLLPEDYMCPDTPFPSALRRRIRTHTGGYCCIAAIR